MKVVLIGGGEPGLQLLSWLSADSSTRVPLVIEPDRQALIHQVETLGFRWAGSGGPPVISDSADTMNPMAPPPDLVIATTEDAGLVGRVRALLPATIPLLLPDDVELCRRLHDIVSAQSRQADEGPDEEAGPVGDGIEQVELFLERYLGSASWPVLLERLIWWMQWICGASKGSLFVYRGWGRRLQLEQAGGLAQSEGERLLHLGLARQAVDGHRIVQYAGGETTGYGETLTAVPLALDERPVGAIVLAGPSSQRGVCGAARDRSEFALSWLAIRLAGLLCRGMQMEWARESGLRDQLRRGTKEIIGRELPAGEACRQGVALIANHLSAASCRLYCRGPRAGGWVASASMPASQASWEPAEHPWRGTVMLTAASLVPLLLVQEPQKLLYLPFALGAQGDGVLVIEHPAAETWSVQLVELLTEMGQLLGTVAQRAEEVRP